MYEVAAFEKTSQTNKYSSFLPVTTVKLMGICAFALKEDALAIVKKTKPINLKIPTNIGPDLGLKLQKLCRFVCKTYKPCDWSMRISLVILLVLSLVRMSLLCKLY